MRSGGTDSGAIATHDQLRFARPINSVQIQMARNRRNDNFRVWSAYCDKSASRKNVIILTRILQKKKLSTPPSRKMEGQITRRNTWPPTINTETATKKLPRATKMIYARGNTEECLEINENYHKKTNRHVMNGTLNDGLSATVLLICLTTTSRVSEANRT